MLVLSNMCWEASQKRLERESRASWAKAWRLLLGRALHQGLPGGQALKLKTSKKVKKSVQFASSEELTLSGSNRSLTAPSQICRPRQVLLAARRRSVRGWRHWQAGSRH